MHATRAHVIRKERQMLDSLARLKRSPYRSPARQSGDGQRLATVTPLPSAIARVNTSREPTDLQREVLRLLSIGETDAAIARKLSISLRTGRRRVAELKRMLAVTSRVEVALAAAQRGWIK